MRSPVRPWTVLFSLAVCLLAVAAGAAENAAESEARLKQHATFLASDALEGRGPGTAGSDAAAEYIAARFAEMGLRTDLFNGQPFQVFEVPLGLALGPAEQNHVVLTGPPDDSGQPRKSELKLGESFQPLAIGGPGKFAAPLVFAGYGITAKDLKHGGETIAYDDYAGLDVQGKVVILLRKAPLMTEKEGPFGTVQKPAPHATFFTKLSNAATHGAAAVILVNDGPELASQREQNTKLLQAALASLAELKEKLGAASPEEFTKLAGRIAVAAREAADLSQQLAAGSDTVLPFTTAGSRSMQRKLPVLSCTRAAVDALLKDALHKDLATLEQEIAGDLKPRSAVLAGWQAAGETNIVERKTRVKNVVAVLEGQGPLADETIVVGAHYDHLGLGDVGGSLAPWTRAIHNGADDNASGTSTLLEVAQRLASSGNKPRRRIVFIAFAGEELGLHGSAFYCRQPRFPLEKTIAMFNLDMVGRLKDERLIVYGTGTAKEFDPLADKLSQQLGFQLTKHAGGFGPSDHSSFYAKKIPVLHLFTGTHTDYHRPSDDSEKLNIAGMRRIADWLLEAIQATDATDGRPTYLENKKFEQIADSQSPSQSPGDPVASERPSFGSMPAYPNPVKDGVLLEAVREGSAADRAGIKAGDILIQLGETRVIDLDAFQAALTSHKAGDTVKAKVRRGDKTIEAEVTLGRSRGP